jgi:histidine ammonia-lyase
MTIDIGAQVDWETIRMVREKPDTRLAFGRDARRRVSRSRTVVERALREQRVVYGLTTGFGPLSDVRIAPDRARRLQRNLVLSHALPVGDPIPPEECRLVVYLRMASLARGMSGCTPEMLDWLLAAHNKRVFPVLHEGGSVGASGDLAPLALVGAFMMGLGDAWIRGERWSRRSARYALRTVRLKPYVFREKEALSLINGTQFSLARIAAAVWDARRILDAADVVAALTIEALRGSAAPFDPRVALAKRHPGVKIVCDRVRRLLEGSPIQRSHRDCPKVQDAYSLRCVPQVHGAARDALAFAERTVLDEANAAVDNPIVAPDGAVISAGNFHAQHLAIAADTLTAALASVANISERRIERLTNPQTSELPAFLARDPGLNSGLMVLQISAAALAAECRALAYPASVSSIPTTAGKEDHVSMAPISAAHLRRVVDRVAEVVAREAVCAVQALEFLRPLEPGPALRRAVAEVRKRVRPLSADRMLGADVDAVRRMVQDGSLERSTGGAR